MAFMFNLGNLIKSYKRLPFCGSSCRTSNTYRFIFEHGKKFSDNLSFFNQKRNFVHPSKPHFIPSTLVSELNENSNAKIKPISDHLRKHAKPISDEAFGYYLAGLIEANGRISNDKLKLTFDEKDHSLAYFIKKRVGYGKVISDDSVTYLLEHPQGLKAMLTLTNGKFLTSNFIDQLLNNEYDQKYEVSILPPADFNIQQNHFLAGFCDLAGYFSIIISDDTSDLEVKLCFLIRTNLPQQKDPTIFQKVQSEFGGSIYLDDETGIYHYEASSFQTNLKTVAYFDQFHLNSTRFVDYFKWRKAYRVIQRGEHHNQKGLVKLTKLKGSMVHKYESSV
ncbi:homing endonuclease [Rhizophagus irregularis]|uniref:Homing endonuclease n=1 Tax=Rhizophagus irregularis TaxID=588596 RepID=A0A2N1P444_9GLOM|nr:homing endonuclease [Rhizophagus irregularis]